jgi:histone acetyltransferase
VKSHAAAWPFLKPVDKNDVPDYYDHIKYPMGEFIYNKMEINSMIFLKRLKYGKCIEYIINVLFICADLKTMGDRLKNHYYVSKRLFIADMTRICTNCRLYNSPDTEYYRCANLLEKYFQTRMREMGLWDK